MIKKESIALNHNSREDPSLNGKRKSHYVNVMNFYLLLISMEIIFDRRHKKWHLSRKHMASHLVVPAARDTMSSNRTNGTHKNSNRSNQVSIVRLD